MDRKKKTGVAILISDKIDFRRRTIKRHPEGHFIILKGRIHQEDKNIAILNKALDEMDLTDIYRAFHPKEAK